MNVVPGVPLEVKNTSDIAAFLKIKQLEAQVALLRGFLHEVNNAFAGIGTLAEVLKGVDSPTLQKNLDLMAATTRRSTALQYRIRAFYSPSEAALELPMGAFIEENKDLLELMLPHHQRLACQIDAAADDPIVTTKPETLWGFLALLMMCVRECDTPRATLALGADGLLRCQLEPTTTHHFAADNTWAQALGLYASWLGARLTCLPKQIEVSFAT